MLRSDALLEPPVGGVGDPRDAAGGALSVILVMLRRMSVGRVMLLRRMSVGRVMLVMLLRKVSVGVIVVVMLRRMSVGVIVVVMLRRMSVGVIVDAKVVVMSLCLHITWL